jgi:hypothetical protein
MTYDVGNPDPGLEQTQNNDFVKSVNGILGVSDWNRMPQLIVLSHYPFVIFDL